MSYYACLLEYYTINDPWLHRTHLLLLERSAAEAYAHAMIQIESLRRRIGIKGKVKKITVTRTEVTW